MGYPSEEVRLPCDTPPVGLVHALAALVYRGNQAGGILKVGCIGCQRHDACTPPTLDTTRGAEACKASTYFAVASATSTRLSEKVGARPRSAYFPALTACTVA